MRSRNCARMGVQFSALTLDSKPAASNAHIVVNMASLPSTVTLVTGAARYCRRAASAGATAGACVWGAGAFLSASGFWDCERTAAGVVAQMHKAATAIFMEMLVM